MTFKQSSCTTLVFVAAAMLLGSATPARAQAYVAPFLGYNFGEDARCPQITDCHDKSMNFGIGLGKAGGLFGFEQEFAYAKDFFGEAPGLESSVLTVMSNVMVIPKLNPIRPYFLMGLGLIKTDVELNPVSLLSSSFNNLGWNIGGGVMIGAKHVAVRGDVRFFHSYHDIEVAGITLLDNKKLDFGRASVGLVLGF